MENPFFFGKTVSGDAFINRQKEISDLSSYLGRGQNVIVFSPRRFGKTSLIKMVLQRLKREKILVFYIDLYRTASLEQFYRYYSQTVTNSLLSPLNKVFGLMQTIIPSLKPKLVYTEPNVPSIEFEFGLEALRKEKTLRELFDMVEKICIERKKRACIVFDEFQEIRMMEESDLLEREMRAAFQHHTQVSYAFLGSVTHLMNDIFVEKSKPFYNFGVHYELQTIAASEWQKHIEKKFSEVNIRLESGCIEQLLTLTGGHPFYTQMVCSELWENTTNKRSITTADCNEAMYAALEKEKHAIAETWDSLTLTERKLLLAMAHSAEQSNIFSSQFLVSNQLGASSSIQRAVGKLLKRGILVKKGTVYYFSDPLFKLWLTKEDKAT